MCCSMQQVIQIKLTVKEFTDDSYVCVDVQ